MNPVQRYSNLIRNNEENKGRKDDLILYRFDTDGNVKLRSVFTFPIGTEIFLKSTGKKEITFYRIYRAKDVFFAVEKLYMSIKEKNFVLGYKLKDKKKSDDLFDKEVKSEFTKVDYYDFQYNQSVLSANEIAIFLPEIFDKKTDRSYYFKMIKKFFDKSFVGSFKYTDEEIEDFMKDVNYT